MNVIKDELSKEQLEVKQNVEACKCGVMLEAKKEDFKKFKLLPSGNRNIKRANVNKLKNTISKNGFCISKPILVNEHYQIIDGQHRFTACKELGHSFFYVMSAGVNPDTLVDMNTTQWAWGTNDFVKHYADKGLYSYKELLKFHKEFNVSISTCITIIINAVIGGQNSRQIRNGSFSATPKQFADARARMQQINTVVNLMRIPATDRLIRALVVAGRHKSFSFNKFISKLSYQMEKPCRCSTTNGYLTVFEDIYNNKNKEKISLVIK